MPEQSLSGGEDMAKGAMRRLAVAGAWPRRLRADLARSMIRARTDLVLWVPIALGTGIGVYFLWPGEPSFAVVAALSVCVALALPGWAFAPEAWRFPAALVAILCIGFLMAVLRAHAVAAPVLPFRYYGPVEGRVVEIDRSARDQIRVTLDHVTLRDVDAARSPSKVRIALHSGGAPPEPGSRVRLMAHLQPPPGPAEPGAWDFRRSAWFMGLGAVGYSRKPAQVSLAPDDGSLALAGDRVRRGLSQAMQARMPGQAGAVAAALMTGDRSGISAATNDAMRASGLYHIVSISGLHMGMLAGFVFGAIRYGLALCGTMALYWPTKKIAALVALIAASIYLWIAGPEVATQRSYLMAAVMLMAVLFDRRALSLRTVALAAIVVLCLRPESLTEPGFQMSFAATVALILALGPWARIAPKLHWGLRPVIALALTSVVAGLATGPIAAAQFGRISGYGLLANMLAVPVMGAFVMPAGVIAAVLAPIGLAALPLWVMDMGTRWMIFVAEKVAGLSGAQSFVPEPQWAVLPLMGAGAVLAVVMRGRGRALGATMVMAAFALWCGSARPQLLIAPEGQVVGVMTAEGRALSKPGAAFLSSQWLQADGDEATPEQAAARGGFTGPRAARVMIWQGRTVVHLSGSKAPARVAEFCQDGAIIVLAGVVLAGDALELPMGAPRDCMLWDVRRLRRTGAVAFFSDGQIVTARARWHESHLWERSNTPRRIASPRGNTHRDGAVTSTVEAFASR